MCMKSAQSHTHKNVSVTFSESRIESKEAKSKLVVCGTHLSVC